MSSWLWVRKVFLNDTQNVNIINKRMINLSASKLVMLANDATDKGLISKIYKQFIQLNNKTQNTQSENGQKTKKDISPKKTFRWPIGT